MSKPHRAKKSPPAATHPAAYSPLAQEFRALLRRVPDGFQATLQAMAARDRADREAVMMELARGMGKEILPLMRAAALGAQEELALSALRTLPVFGTRAAGDILLEVYGRHPGGERADLARRGAEALAAHGVHVALPDAPAAADAPRMVLRETSVSPPDGVGSRSVVARLQDRYGVWHAIFVMWNDQAGVKDCFMRPMSRHEWTERIERFDARRGWTRASCPPDYGRWQVAQARALNEQTGFPLVVDLDEWDRVIGPPPAGYTPPDPTLPVIQATDAQRSLWIDEGERLFEGGDVRTWFLEAADCVEWGRKWSDIHNRIRLRGDSDQLQDDTRTLVRAAAEALLGPPTVSLHRERLLDLARVREWQRAEQDARRAAAVVVALDAGRAVGEIPYFTGLVRRTLIATAAMLERGEDPERRRYNPMKRYQQ